MVFGLDSTLSSEKLIEITVTHNLKCTPEQIFKVLWDWERFSDWWSVPVTLLQEEILVVKPLPFVSIFMIRSEADPPKRLIFNYIKGPFRGEGIWQIKEISDRAGYSHVQYTIRLYPINLFVQLVASTWFFRAKHRYDIYRIFDQLCDEVHLSNY